MWHEARRSEKKVHEVMDAARRRAQRRAVYLAKRRGDPQQSLQLSGARCRIQYDTALYNAIQDQQGLIPWNGKQNILIDRYDGRALLDFIREPDPRVYKARKRTQEEEELEEFVNFERYRDLIKLRCRGLTDEEGLESVKQELEARAVEPFAAERSVLQASAANKGAYSQVGFVYEGDNKEDQQYPGSDEDDEEEDEKSTSSDDSEVDEVENVARDYGVKRFNWLVYMDRKAKEEERRQKEVIKGDPALRKLSRKERRKVSQQEREREKEVARGGGPRFVYHDPYRELRRSPTYEAYPRSRVSRSRSRSLSPHSRHHDRGWEESSRRRSKGRDSTAKIEYITEFGVTTDGNDYKMEAVSPPPSPPSQAGLLNRHSSGQILEALHVDPAASVGSEWERKNKEHKPSASTTSAIAKLNKASSTAVQGSKQQQTEKKETPQERLKRIMSRQLNKQIKKDAVVELNKRREQERQRQEKLAETSRIARHRHRSRSQSRSYSRSQSRSPIKYRHSRSRSRSPRRYYSRSRSPRSLKSFAWTRNLELTKVVMNFSQTSRIDAVWLTLQRRTCKKGQPRRTSTLSYF